jgi:NitT/TauT family transport system ATP-binding protein
LLRLWRSTGKTVVMVTHDVAEAVYLSDRVCIMSARPGKIVETFDISLPHEDGREAVMLSERYTRLHNQVWMSVRRQVTA